MQDPEPAPPAPPLRSRRVERTLIADLPAKVDERVRVRGWVQAVRDQKRMQFVVVRDETGLAQAVLEKADPPSELNERVSALTAESAVTLTGTIAADERVKLGGLELRVEGLELDAPAEPELPVAPESALDKRIDWRYLDLRRPDRRLIFEIQTTIEHAMREHWRAQGFLELHTPKFMGSASESGAELFKVEYFERTAYLAQSPQFYKQMAMAAGFGKVFEVGPVFRANPSFTSRHDTEFTSVDVEISWIDSHEDVMAFEEALAGARLQRRRGRARRGDRRDLRRRGRGALAAVPADPARPGQGAAARPTDMSTSPGPTTTSTRPSERALSAIVARGARPRVRVPHRLPHRGAALLPHAPPRAAWAHQELRPAVARHRDHHGRAARAPLRVLLAQARDKRVETEPIQYYLDFFRYGAPPHGGFGFGLTRLLMQMTGQDNVREVTFLYRGPNRLEP